RQGPDVFEAASSVPSLDLGIYFGPRSLRLLGCHALRIHWQRRRWILFERVVVDGADLAVGRRGPRESGTNAGHGRGDSARDLRIRADQLSCTLTNVAGESLSVRLPGCPLCGR